jgi:predicted dithiol-disulfide oxidoreductase (DUF899 family)
MNPSPTVSREQWQAARLEVLAKEKELSRARDELAERVRRLPMMSVDKDYVFEAPGGQKLSLLDLFDGRRQLIVYHWMWPLPYVDWCPLCSFWIDNLGNLAHLNARDTTLVVDCPAPLVQSVPFRDRMGWTVPWVSSFGSDFFDDFHAVMDDPNERERPGVSVFLRDGDAISYGYSTYRRGADLLNTTYNYLDLTPLGRQEPDTGFKQEWVHYHDEYDRRPDGVFSNGEDAAAHPNCDCQG